MTVRQHLRDYGLWRGTETLAALFREETLPALAQSHRSDLHVELARLRWRRDSETRLRISGRTARSES